MKKLVCIILLGVIVFGCCGCSLLYKDKVNGIPLSESVIVEFVDEDGTVWLTNQHIQSVSLMAAEMDNTINFELTVKGSQAMAAATQANIGKTLEVRINGETVFSPVVNAKIEDTSFWLYMGEDYDKCVALFETLTGQNL